MALTNMSKAARWIALACNLILLSNPALAAMLMGKSGGGALAPPPSYTGPCDVITGGCAAAYSVTRAMTNAYSGPLFQLVRRSDSTTLDVGQQSNHVVDTSSIAAFCKGSTGIGDYCLYNLVYDQINGNTWHAPIRSVEGGQTPTFCNSAIACDPVWWIDPETGLPAIRTPYPTGFIGPHFSTGITGGTHALSLMMNGRNEAHTKCCGQFDVGHTAAANSNIIGTVFGMEFNYANTTARYIECSTLYTFCSGSEYEQQHDYANYGSTLEDVIQTVTWDGASATNTVNDYLNGMLIFSKSPPSANCGAPLPACKNGTSPGTGIHLVSGTETSLGMGGDNTQSDTIFREGLITNSAISVSDEAAARSDMTTFYGAYSPSVCRSTADMSYYFDNRSPTSDQVPANSSALLAVGLRQMGASQTGPVADLRDVVTNVVNTYGPASSGCGLDPAAVTFCATNGCAVQTLYNQSTFSTSTSNNAYDSRLSMTAASPAAQPTVTFNSLNGLPTMHFTGTQMLCTRTLVSTNVASPIGYSVVARRTIGAGAGLALSHTYASNSALSSVGWPATADTFNNVVGGTTMSGTATDGHWHQIGWEGTTRAATNANSYLNGATLSPNVSVGAGTVAFSQGKVCIGGREDSGPNLSGDVAEAVVSAPTSPTSVGFATLEPTIFSLDQTAWGTLPN